MGQKICILEIGHFFESEKMKSTGPRVEMKIFYSIFFDLGEKRSNGWKKICILGIGQFSDPKKMESIGPGVKMKIFWSIMNENGPREGLG